MILPFCLSIVLASAHSGNDMHIPVYTRLPDGTRVEIMFDLTSYLVAISIGFPLFLLILGIHFHIRQAYETHLEKQKKPVRRTVNNVGIYSVDYTRRQRIYDEEAHLR